MTDEHFLQIFAFLDARTLTLAQLVCRRWRVLADDHTLWRDLCHAFLSIDNLPRLLPATTADAAPPLPANKQEVGDNCEDELNDSEGGDDDGEEGEEEGAGGGKAKKEAMSPRASWNKEDFRLERFGLAAVPANWKVLHRRFCVR